MGAPIGWRNRFSSTRCAVRTGDRQVLSPLRCQERTCHGNLVTLIPFAEPARLRRLDGAGAALLGLGGAPETFGRTAIAQDDARVFHAAWPYVAPPQEHFNAFVTDAIMMPPNIYGDMIRQPFALYNWGEQAWMPLMATGWAFVRSDSGAATPEASPGSSRGRTPSRSRCARGASGTTDRRAPRRTCWPRSRSSG